MSFLSLRTSDWISSSIYSQLRLNRVSVGPHIVFRLSISYRCYSNYSSNFLILTSLRFLFMNVVGVVWSVWVSLGHLELLKAAAFVNLPWFELFRHGQSLFLQSSARTDCRFDILYGLSVWAKLFLLLSGIGRKREHLLFVLVLWELSWLWSSIIACFSFCYAVMLLRCALSKSSRLIDFLICSRIGVSESITETISWEIIGVLISRLSSCTCDPLLTSSEALPLPNSSLEMFVFSPAFNSSVSYTTTSVVFCRPTDFASFLYFSMISLIFSKLSYFGLINYADMVFLWRVVWWVCGLGADFSLLGTDFSLADFGPSL